VVQIILDGTEIKAAEFSAWVAWANGLQSKPVTERLLAINTRVNKDFKFATDQQFWGKPDKQIHDPESKAEKHLPSKGDGPLRNEKRRRPQAGV
jgi:hypothetical protein